MQSLINLHNFEHLQKHLAHANSQYIQFITNICQYYQLEIMQLDIIFLSDQELHSLNYDFLKHDTYTDIITFAYHEDQQPIWSDIYISYQRLLANSRKYKVSIEQELLRLLAHGILHLIGMCDKSPEEQLKMRAAEDFWIQNFYTNENRQAELES